VVRCPARLEGLSAGEAHVAFALVNFAGARVP